MNGNAANSNGHTTPTSSTLPSSTDPSSTPQLELEQQQLLQQQQQQSNVTHPPPLASDPSTTTPLGLNRQELVRLLIQSMDSLGYSESARKLEDEAGIESMSREMRKLRHCVLNGEWETLEEILNSEIIKKVFKNEKDEKLARFVIYEQKFLELLESRRTAEALSCLRNHLTKLSPDPKLFDKLPLLCLCSTPSEVREHASWLGTGYLSRLIVLKKLYKYIPSFHLLQENRLENLLVQTVTRQKKETMFPYTKQKQASLLEDLEHASDSVPTSKIFKLHAHTDEVWFVQFSQNGHYLASASKDSTIIIWNIQSIMQHHAESANNLSTSGNGSRNLNNGTGSKGSFNSKRDRRESRRERRMRDDDDDDDDDDEDEDEVEVYEEDEDFDFDDENADQEIKEDENPIVIKDGRFVHQRLQGHTSMICSLSWAPKSSFIGDNSDERLLSCGHDKTVRLWNTRTGDCMNVFQGHTKEISVCCWLNDGIHFVSGGVDGKIYEWDSRNGRPSCHYEARGHVYDMTVSRDGKTLIASCSDKTIQVFNVESKKEEYVIREDANIPSMNLSHDKELLMVSTYLNEDAVMVDPEIHIWNLKQRKIERRLKGFKQVRFIVRCCFAGAENTFVVCGSEDGLVYVWERSSGELITKLRGHKGIVNTVAVSMGDENLFASGSDDKTIIV